MVIRGTNWIGDAVMTFPALSALTSFLKDSSIDILARPWVCPVYECHEKIRKVIPLENKQGFNRWFTLIKEAKKIKSANYDTAILFPNSFESALLFKLAGIPQVIGYATDLRGPLLSKKIKVPREKNKRHEVFYYLNLIKKAFSIKNLDKKRPKIQFKIPQSALKAGSRLLESEGWEKTNPLIGINPGAAYGPAKCWPVKRYKELVQLILNKMPDANIAIFGTKNEIEIGQIIKGPEKRIFNLCGKTSLMEAIAIISKLHLMITNDSGLMHVAAGCNIPIVAIFGSTNPITTGPWSEKAIIVRKQLACSPCLKRDCSKGFHCMLDIEVKDVFDALIKQLDRNY